jgi:hypothetical protein
MASLENCCEDFRNYLTDLAATHGKPVETLFAWWQEYTRDCSNYDQSPVIGEFERWYAAKLAA